MDVLNLDRAGSTFTEVLVRHLQAAVLIDDRRVAGVKHSLRRAIDCPFHDAHRGEQLLLGALEQCVNSLGRDGTIQEPKAEAELLMRELKTVAVIGEAHPPRDLLPRATDVQVDECQSELKHCGDGAVGPGDRDPIRLLTQWNARRHANGGSESSQRCGSQAFRYGGSVG